MNIEVKKIQSNIEKPIEASNNNTGNKETGDVPHIELPKIYDEPQADLQSQLPDEFIDTAEDFEEQQQEEIEPTCKKNRLFGDLKPRKVDRPDAKIQPSGTFKNVAIAVMGVVLASKLLI